MSGAFTKGPWTAETYREFAPNYAVFAGQKEPVAKLIEIAADARLIAAAPELFEALEQLLAITDDPSNDADEEESVFPFARRVLAKARGEQSS